MCLVHHFSLKILVTLYVGNVHHLDKFYAVVANSCQPCPQASLTYFFYVCSLEDVGLRLSRGLVTVTRF